MRSDDPGMMTRWQGDKVRGWRQVEEAVNSSRAIRVMLVDDHAVVRSGLAAFLLAYDDLDLVGEASDGEEAVALCERLLPDVVIMDLVMPRMDGAAATRAIRERFPDIQVLALTSFKEDDLVQNALKAGAIGYLLKNISAHELAEAVRAAHVGRPTLAPEAAESLIQTTRKKTGPAIGHDLTEREREVLKLMSEGLNNMEIAERLIVSLSTAKFHVSNVLSKLHVNTRTEAVALALQNKLID
jgi:two-component system, NarL family, response regulator LiaR